VNRKRLKKFLSLSNRIQIRTIHTRSKLPSVHLQNQRFIETTKFKFLPQEITDFVTWKPTHFLRPGTRLRTNFLSACWPPEGSQWTWNIVVIHTIRNTAFTQLIFLLLFFLFIYLAEVPHRYCLGGALHVGMYRPRKALLDCPLLQHSSPGPKWTICMLSRSAQSIQINLFTW